MERFWSNGHPGFDFLQPFDDDALAWLEPLINNPEITGPLSNFHGTDVDLVFRRDDGNLVTPLHLGHGPLWHENRLLFGLGHRPDPRKLPGPQEIVGIRKQRLLGPKAAATYLGICEDTLKKITDLGQLRAFNMNGRRAYRLEDLDAYVESLPGWYDSTGEKSAKVVGDRRVS